MTTYKLTLTATLTTDRPLTLHLEDLEFDLTITPQGKIAPSYTTKDYWEDVQLRNMRCLMEFVQANPDGDAHTFLTEMQEANELPLRLKGGPNAV